MMIKTRIVLGQLRHVPSPPEAASRGCCGVGTLDHSLFEIGAREVPGRSAESRSAQTRSPLCRNDGLLCRAGEEDKSRTNSMQLSVHCPANPNFVKQSARSQEKGRRSNSLSTASTQWRCTTITIRPQWDSLLRPLSTKSQCPTLRNDRGGQPLLHASRHRRTPISYAKSERWSQMSCKPSRNSSPPLETAIPTTISRNSANNLQRLLLLSMKNPRDHARRTHRSPRM
jgi:hypothetical protein